ncbi:hypothetical protein ACQP00_20505 [Dactylosporangium sp. CS-047395]|uniref:hypothetical protein n=1 Tax=Dactylosporangium sp. CS-047395 TaxID=3239936 RepID=UPI003D8E7836
MLIVAGPARGEQVWPGPDLLLETIGRTCRGLGDGQDRLRDPWAAHLIADAEWASRQSRTA